MPRANSDDDFVPLSDDSKDDDDCTFTLVSYAKKTSMKKGWMAKSRDTTSTVKASSMNKGSGTKISTIEKGSKTKKGISFPTIAKNKNVISFPTIAKNKNVIHTSTTSSAEHVKSSSSVHFSNSNHENSSPNIHGRRWESKSALTQPQPTGSISSKQYEVDIDVSHDNDDIDVSHDNDDIESSPSQPPKVHRVTHSINDKCDTSTHLSREGDRPPPQFSSMCNYKHNNT